MKKLIISILTVLIAVVSASAQDIIVMRNSTVIQAKIKNISQNEITYSKWSNLDGPTYTINKNEVNFIQYENGEKDVFNETNSSQEGNGNYSGTGNYSASNNYSNQNDYSSNSGNNYGANSGSNQSDVSMAAVLGLGFGGYGQEKASKKSSANISNAGIYSGSEDFQKQYRRAKSSKVWGASLMAFGMTYLGVMGGFAIGLKEMTYLYGGLAIGVPTSVLGICLLSSGKKKLKQLNSGISYAPSFEYPIQINNVTFVPSVGVTNDLIASRQCLSAGLALRF